mgnify:CR=1 FL=1
MRGRGATERRREIEMSTKRDEAHRGRRSAMAVSHAFASADAPRAQVGRFHDSAADAGDSGAGEGSAFSRP